MAGIICYPAHRVAGQARIKLVRDTNEEGSDTIGLGIIFTVFGASISGGEPERDYGSCNWEYCQECILRKNKLVINEKPYNHDHAANIQEQRRCACDQHAY